MRLLRSLCMALSMYSRLPVPRVEWKSENMAYALCFFPVVGAAIAIIWLIWLAVAGLVGLGGILTGAVASLLPLVVTGGIHMDGFCDTADALGSNATRERMLEIMHDPRAGVSAVTACAAYTLLSFALWAELLTAGYEKTPAFMAVLFIPVLSRALSALGVACLKSARGDGLLVTFKTAADTATVRVVSVLWALAAVGVMVWRAPLQGGAVALTAAVAFIAYTIWARKRFGGVTGDIAGFFVQVCELACLAAFVLSAKIGGVL